ncbi:MAG TPA: PilZ domain-containing protein [Pyrinomonadaceae bacterium]|nr:PilZ domain-containing protein [Pyrinomonadaceae bacterium]
MSYPREVERVPTSIPVNWGVTRECLRRGTITSLSVKGCLIEAKIEALYGKPIFINFRLPTERWLFLQGEVIYYLRNVGFGIQFTKLTEEDKGMLSLLVDYFRVESAAPKVGSE